MKIWGNRCNLDQIEQIIKTITTSCACAGVDDKVTAFVTQEGLDKTVIDLLVSKTGLNPIAFQVKQIDAIPVTPSGKIDYPQLQQMI